MKRPDFLFLLMALVFLMFGATDLREWWHSAALNALVRAVAFLLGAVVWLLQAYGVKAFTRHRAS